MSAPSSPAKRSNKGDSAPGSPAKKVKAGSTYKLMYFDVRGLAEVSRAMFAVAKVEYEDFRFPFAMTTPGDFSTLVRKEFDAAKEAGELNANCGKVPILEVDGVRVGQSKPIERFLAARFGMMGGSEIESFQTDALCAAVQDVKDAYQKVRAITGEDAKKAAMTEWFDEKLPAECVKIEKSLPDGKGPFTVGSKISLGDFHLFMLLAAPKGFFDNSEGAKAAYRSCPRIGAAMEAVAANEELKAWFAKRPETMF